MPNHVLGLDKYVYGKPDQLLGIAQSGIPKFCPRTWASTVFAQVAWVVLWQAQILPKLPNFSLDKLLTGMLAVFHISCGLYFTSRVGCISCLVWAVFHISCGLYFMSRVGCFTSRAGCISHSVSLAGY